MVEMMSGKYGLHPDTELGHFDGGPSFRSFGGRRIPGPNYILNGSHAVYRALDGYTGHQ